MLLNLSVCGSKPGEILLHIVRITPVFRLLGMPPSSSVAGHILTTDMNDSYSVFCNIVCLLISVLFGRPA